MSSPDPSDAGPRSEPGPRSYPGPLLRVTAGYGWRLLIIAICFYLVVRELGHLGTVIIPFTLAVLLTAALRPAMNFMTGHGVPRLLATLLSFLLAIVVIGGVIALVVDRAVNQAPQFADEINKLIPKVENWLVRGPLHLARGQLNNFANTLTKQVNKNESAIASTAVHTGRTVLDVLAGLVLGVFCTIFLLYDGPRVWAWVCAGFPVAVRRRVDRAGQAAWVSLTHYVRSILIVATFHGIVMSITLLILGVPLVTPLALIVALGSFVPLIGTVVTGALAVGIAGISNGIVAAIIVAAVLVVDNQVDAHVLQPLVVGRYVHVHPLAIVLALASGAILFGIFGALIAVPLVACFHAGFQAFKELPEDGAPPEMITPDVSD